MDDYDWNILVAEKYDSYLKMREEGMFLKLNLTIVKFNERLYIWTL